VSTTTGLNAQFAPIGGTNFAVTGTSLGRDWAILGTGLNWNLGRGWQAYANYDAQVNVAQTFHVGSGGFQYSWQAGHRPGVPAFPPPRHLHTQARTTKIAASKSAKKKCPQVEEPQQAMANETNVHWHEHSVSRQEREKLSGHSGCVIWFTGLSACGKSTISNLVDHKLHSRGIHTYVLDGDNIRMGLNAGPGMLKERHGEEFAKRFGIGFSAIDREENIRRIGAVAKLFSEAGLVTLTAFISPYRRDRDAVRASMPAGDFIEIFVDAPLEVCEKRDPKGLYKKARAGEIKGFTGIDDPYEAPEKPELVLDAGKKTADALAEEVIAYLAGHGKIR
jgi:adenylylsulfate kinase